MENATAKKNWKAKNKKKKQNTMYGSKLSSAHIILSPFIHRYTHNICCLSECILLINTFFFTCECLLITVGWTVLELSKYSVYPAKWIQSIFIHYRILYLPMEFGTLTNTSFKLYKLWSQKWICVLEFSEEGERDKDGGVRVTVYGNVYHWLWDW